LCDLCKIKEEGFCCPEHCCDVSEFIKKINYKLNSGIIADAIIVKKGKIYKESKNLSRNK
jgi:hypothetical protein